MPVKISGALILILSLGIFSSCRQPNQNEVTLKQAGPQYVLRFDDAKKILPEWSRQNAVVLHLSADPANLHPASFTNTSAVFVLGLTQGYLLKMDLLEPQLIPGITQARPQVSDDATRYTYQLLKEAAWDDGTPVTAEDVNFTFKAHQCALVKSPLIRPYVANIAGVETDASDPKKFTLVMKQPYVQNENFVTDIPILQRSYFDPENILGAYTFDQFRDSAFNAEGKDELLAWSNQFNDGRYASDPAFFNGCGAYRVTSWERGQTLILERKNNHWTSGLKAPGIVLSALPEKIIVKMIRDENAMLLEFKSQTLDASFHVPTKVLMDLQRDSLFNLNYRSAFLLSSSFTSLAMNQKPDGIQHKKIFDDLRVRKALALVTPVEQIISVAILGKAVRWPSMISPLRPDYNESLPLLPVDVAAANRLLDEAGWKDADADGVREKKVDGQTISLEAELLVIEQGAISRDIVNMIAESAAAAGFKIIPRPLEGGTLQQKLRAHDFDCAITTWSLGTMQEDQTQLWHSSSWAEGTNFTGFGDAVSDALIDSIKFTMNDSLRYSMSRRLQQMIYEAQPSVFMYSVNRKIILHQRWGNQVMSTEFPCIAVNYLALLAASSPTAMMLMEN